MTQKGGATRANRSMGTPGDRAFGRTRQEER
jgi:hypothetical protein